MAKKGRLDDEVETWDKKQLIEKVLIEAGKDHGDNLPKLRGCLSGAISKECCGAYRCRS